MKRGKDNSGFTLIELLVVIAIIGILSAVVLGSLTRARLEGENANIRASLNSARAQAVLYFQDSTTYLGLCTTGDTGTVRGVLDFIEGAGEQLPGGASDVVCNDDVNAWALSAPLRQTSPQEYYCVDSEGYALIRPSVLGEDETSCL